MCELFHRQLKNKKTKTQGLAGVGKAPMTGGKRLQPCAAALSEHNFKN